MVSGVDTASIRSTLSPVIRVLASWLARDGSDWVSRSSNLDLVGLAFDRKPAGQRLANMIQHIAVGLAEAAERAGARADEADLQDVLGFGGIGAIRADEHRAGGSAPDQDIAPRDAVRRTSRMFRIACHCLCLPLLSRASAAVSNHVLFSGSCSWTRRFRSRRSSATPAARTPCFDGATLRLRERPLPFVITSWICPYVRQRRRPRCAVRPCPLHDQRTSPLRIGLSHFARPQSAAIGSC